MGTQPQWSNTPYSRAPLRQSRSLVPTNCCIAGQGQPHAPQQVHGIFTPRDVEARLLNNTEMQREVIGLIRGGVHRTAGRTSKP
ncbi:hypothetical protein [Glutamicibacter sp. NPDC087344]|uniref:hypothetical protein n=1 Tax=Glutamicibacter sp. NPDC087344 TaxID=3363994 RepID=UPI0038134493